MTVGAPMAEGGWWARVIALITAWAALVAWLRAGGDVGDGVSKAFFIALALVVPYRWRHHRAAAAGSVVSKRDDLLVVAISVAAAAISAFCLGPLDGLSAVEDSLGLVTAVLPACVAASFLGARSVLPWMMTCLLIMDPLWAILTVPAMLLISAVRAGARTLMQHRR